MDEIPLEIMKLPDWVNIFKLVLYFTDFRDLLSLISCSKKLNFLAQEEMRKRQRRYIADPEEYNHEKFCFYAKRCIGYSLSAGFIEENGEIKEISYSNRKGLRIACGKYENVYQMKDNACRICQTKRLEFDARQDDLRNKYDAQEEEKRKKNLLSDYEIQKFHEMQNREHREKRIAESRKVRNQMLHGDPNKKKTIFKGK